MAEFFAMGGHAFYVWTSFGLFAITLLYSYIAPIQKRHRLMRDLARNNSGLTNDEK